MKLFFTQQVRKVTYILNFIGDSNFLANSVDFFFKFPSFSFLLLEFYLS